MIESDRNGIFSSRLHGLNCHEQHVWHRQEFIHKRRRFVAMARITRQFRFFCNYMHFWVKVPIIIILTISLDSPMSHANFIRKKTFVAKHNKGKFYGASTATELSRIKNMISCFFASSAAHSKGKGWNRDTSDIK